MDKVGLSRRGFMIKTISAIAVFIGAVLSVPLGGFVILPSLRKREPEWSDAGTLEGLLVNEPVERRFMQTVKKGWREQRVERAAWFVRKPDGSVVVFSPNCPHLGCGYRWISRENEFRCPCHISVFDIEGKVLGGPAPRALDRLEVKFEKGRILLKFEVFQLGIPKKVLAFRRDHDHTAA